MPLKELAQEATRLWREEYSRPLKLFGSYQPLFGAVSFYSPDHPLFFTNLNVAHAPWVTRERIKREGLLVVCEASEIATCLDRVRALGLSRVLQRQMTVERAVSYAAAASRFTYPILIVPPDVR